MIRDLARWWVMALAPTSWTTGETSEAPSSDPRGQAGLSFSFELPESIFLGKGANHAPISEGIAANITMMK